MAFGLSVEIHVPLCKAPLSAVLERLGAEKFPDHRYDTYFFETSSMDLYRSGLIVRARKSGDSKSQLTVKLRPLDLAVVGPKWHDVPHFKCEQDRLGGVGTDSCSLARPRSAKQLAEIVVGDKPVWEELSAAQHDFLEEAGPDAVPWSASRALGPVETRTWEIEEGWNGETVTLESWKIPGTLSKEFIEISLRVSSGAMESEKKFRVWLRSRGLFPCETVTEKTRFALLSLLDQKPLGTMR
jgi:hypothetical protein